MRSAPDSPAVEEALDRCREIAVPLSVFPTGGRTGRVEGYRRAFGVMYSDQLTAFFGNTIVFLPAWSRIPAEAKALLEVAERAAAARQRRLARARKLVEEMIAVADAQVRETTDTVRSAAASLGDYDSCVEAVGERRRLEVLRFWLGGEPVSHSDHQDAVKVEGYPDKLGPLVDGRFWYDRPYGVLRDRKLRRRLLDSYSLDQLEELVAGALESLERLHRACEAAPAVAA